MKVEVLQEHFKAALAIADRVRPKRSTLPILSNILLETVEGRLRVVATDLEATVSIYVGAQVHEEGSITAPSDTLKKLVATLPKTKLTLSTLSKDVLTIAAEQREIVMDGRKAEDYPPLPKYEIAGFEFDPLELAQAIDRTVFACAKDASRPILRTVHFEHKKSGEVVSLLGTDGYAASFVQLEVRPYGIKGQSPEFSVNIPIKVLAELRRLLLKQEQRSVTLAFNAKNSVRFSVEKPHADFDSMTVDAGYPSLDKYLSAKNVAASEVAVAEMIAEVEALLPIAKEDARKVRLEFSEKNVTCWAQSTDGAKASGTVAATGGDKWRVCLDGFKLVAALKSIGTERVTLANTGEGAPVRFTPVGDDSYTHILMPMIITW